MRRTLLVPSIALAAALSAIPADAAPAQYVGDCKFTRSGGGGDWTGVAHFQVVLYDSVDTADNPVSADVSCEIRVNGTVVVSTPPQHVVGAGAGAVPFAYTAGDTDVVAFCTLIVGWSDGTPDVETCRTATGGGSGGGGGGTSVPPKAVIDLVAPVYNGAVCPVVGTLAPGVPGVADVTPEGEVHLLGGTVATVCPISSEG